MNKEEYEKKLRSLNPDEINKYNSDLGGGEKTVDQRVREFVDNPSHERRICYLLGLKTEEEKLTDAALASAKSATQSAKIAKISILIAVLALLGSIAQAVLSSPVLYDSLKKPVLLVAQQSKREDGGRNIFLISNPSMSKTEEVMIRLAIKESDIISFLFNSRKIGKITYSEMKDNKGNTLSYLKVANIEFVKILPGEFIGIIVKEANNGDEDKVTALFSNMLPAVISAVHSEGRAEVNALRFSFN